MGMPYLNDTEGMNNTMTTVLQEETENLKNEEEYYIRKRKGKFFDTSKRIFDILVSVLALPIVAIFSIIFGIMIKFEDGGPVFYSQKRVGRDLKEFNIYKMRSMRVNSELSTGSVWAEKNDPRITKTGKVLRKFRIDELPQFINVIKGDMSIIGPRPERLDLTKRFNQIIPGFVERLKVRPGITGLAQVNGGYDITPKEKLEFDLVYINNLSLKQEFSIIMKTIRVVLTGDGSR